MHANHFTDQMEARMLQAYSREAMQWLSWCDDEHDNLLATLEWGYKELASSDVGKRMLMPMSWFWYRRGSVREGYDWCNRILENRVDHEATLSNGLALGAGTLMATWIGDLDTALERAEASLTILKQIDEGPMFALALMGVGVVLLNRGAEAQSRSYFEISLAMFKEFGIDFFASTALMHLGNVEIAAANPVVARKRLEEAHDLAQGIGDNWLVASIVNNLGEVARVQGNYDEARIHYAKSESLYREMGDKGDLARLIHSRGYIALHQGDYDTAEKLFRESLTMFQILGNKRGMAECIAGFAGLALKQEQTERTIRLLGAAQAIMDESHAGWWPSDQAEIKPFLQETRSALGEERFDAIWREGTKISLEQALTYTMSEGAEGFHLLDLSE